MKKVVVSQTVVTVPASEMAEHLGLAEPDQWHVSAPVAGDEPDSVILSGPVRRDDA